MAKFQTEHSITTKKIRLARRSSSQTFFVLFLLIAFLILGLLAMVSVSELLPQSPGISVSSKSLCSKSLETADSATAFMVVSGLVPWRVSTGVSTSVLGPGLVGRDSIDAVYGGGLMPWCITSGTDTYWLGVVVSYPPAESSRASGALFITSADGVSVFGPVFLPTGTIPVSFVELTGALESPESPACESAIAGWANGWVAVWIGDDSPSPAADCATKVVQTIIANPLARE